MKPQLSPNFWLNEFTDSETAHAIGDPNLPTDAVWEELEKLAYTLEAVRYFFGQKTIVISSGYRSPHVNRAVGGVDNSDHVLGMAADIKIPDYGSPRQVAEELAPHMDALGLGQVINEYGRWVHVSTRKPDKAVNRVLTIDKEGVQIGILPTRS